MQGDGYVASAPVRRKHRGRPIMRRPGSGRGGAPTRTRLLALRALERVQRSSAFADLLLGSMLGRSDLNSADRAFATDLVYGTLRWRGRIDYLLSHFLDRDLEKLEPLVANALRLGAYQILFSDRVPPEAAVDESVRCVRAAGAERATGLVNAVLRRLAREHAQIALPPLATQPLEHLTHALSLPPWIAARWLERFGAEEAARLAAACNEAPPQTVRVNRRVVSRDALCAELAERFPDARACRYAEDGLVLGRRGNPALDPAFLAGRFTVQDEASQLVVALLDPKPGDAVLDVCAAPGGKATGIAERVGDAGQVLALDRHLGRSDLVRRAARRLGLAKLACAERDATRPLTDLGSFDRVLVDAPCSGLGTLRRNPDARWRIASGDPEKLAEVQRAILRSAAECVKPGGTLVYSTCTLTAEENESVVATLLAGRRDFRRAAPDELPESLSPLLDSEGCLRTLPHRDDADGFFAARLERNP
jgi:16S rRNA (cytosine967-C5)-methyltransferase